MKKHLLKGACVTALFFLVWYLICYIVTTVEHVPENFRSNVFWVMLVFLICVIGSLLYSKISEKED